LTTKSTWAHGINFETVCRGIENSICFGAYMGKEQVGFSRIITDQATFANLVDVIVWPEYRGLGISRMLMEAVMGHSSVKGVRRFTLATSSAHGLYQKYGFNPLRKPDTFMEVYVPGIYAKAK
jgi:GNAT superfamily N-acetyltransferase